MKNTNKKPNFGHKKNKKWTVYPLVFVLLGIFLLPKTAYFSSINDEKIIELANKERIKRGINIITANQLLTKAALEKGRDILLNQKFQHAFGERVFSAWIKDAGYEYSFAGENLAIDFITSEGAIKAWLNSPTHKKNILNPVFSETGVAVLEGNFHGKNTTLVVQIFGTPIYSKSEQTNENFKKPLNAISGFDIEEDNLLTNVQSGPNPLSLPDSNLEIYAPEKYLAVLKINPAQAQSENLADNDYTFVFAYLLIVSGLALITGFVYPNILLIKNIKQQNHG